MRCLLPVRLWSLALKSQDLLNNRSIILILFLVALGVRLIALKQNAMIAPDGAMYIKMAQLYWTGQYHQELFKDYDSKWW